MNTRFGRAFRYEMQNYFRAVAVLWLAMALIPAAMMALAYSWPERQPLKAASTAIPWRWGCSGWFWAWWVCGRTSGC